MLANILHNIKKVLKALARLMTGRHKLTITLTSRNEEKSNKLYIYIYTYTCYKLS